MFCLAYADESCIGEIYVEGDGKYAWRQLMKNRRGNLKDEAGGFKQKCTELYNIGSWGSYDSTLLKFKVISAMDEGK